MRTLISLFIGGFLCFVLFLQIQEYNQLVITKFRFRFFDLRDRLRLLVALRELSEESWEYKKAIASINFHISQTERASIMRIVEMLSEYHTSKEEERRVEMFSQRVDREDVRHLLTDLMRTTYDLIKRNSWAQMHCIMGIAWLFRRFHHEPTKAAKENVLNPSHALNALKSHTRTIEAAHA